MNRAERRRTKRGAETSSAPIAYLDLHCAGPFSLPKPTGCNKSMRVEMPFDIESLRSQVWSNDGWLVTSTVPPGQGYLAVTVLCGSCARLLLPPELLAAAIRLMPGKG